MATANLLPTATKRPELMQLFTELSGLSWDKQKTVMLRLGVPKRRLKDIEKKNPTSDAKRKMDALECWLKKDSSATWLKLVNALRECKLEILSQIIERQYLENPGKTSFTGGGTTNPIPVSSSAANAALPNLTDKPTLAQLWKLRPPGGKDMMIIRAVAGKWDDVAVLMDFDPTGHTQTAINKDFSTVQEKCTEMFKKWLQGHGSRQPATWEILVEILRDCGFGELATEIETALQ